MAEKSTPSDIDVSMRTDRGDESPSKLGVVGFDIELLDRIYAKLVKVGQEVEKQATKEQGVKLQVTLDSIRSALERNYTKLVRLVEGCEHHPCRGPHLSEDVLLSIYNYVIGKPMKSPKFQVKSKPDRASQGKLPTIKEADQKTTQDDITNQPSRPKLMLECQCQDLNPMFYCQYCTYKALARKILTKMAIQIPNDEAESQWSHSLGINLQNIICDTKSTVRDATKKLNKLKENLLEPHNMMVLDIEGLYYWLLDYSIQNDRPDWSIAITQSFITTKEQGRKFKEQLNKSGANGWRYIVKEFTKDAGNVDANPDPKGCLYEAANKGSTEEFQDLLRSLPAETIHAELKMKSPQYGGNLFHHLVYMSHYKKSRNTEIESQIQDASKWDEAISCMLDVLYEYCWKWAQVQDQNKQSFKNTDSKHVEYYRSLAILELIFWVEDRNHWNAFSAAALYASPSVVKVMLSKEPIYLFPSGYYGVFKDGYAVDIIDPVVNARSRSTGLLGRDKPPSQLELKYEKINENGTPVDKENSDTVEDKQEASKEKLSYTAKVSPSPAEMQNITESLKWLVNYSDNENDKKSIIPSFLELVVRRDPKDAASILKCEPLKTLVEEKWNNHWLLILLWFVIYVGYMSIYTACAVTRPINATSISNMYHSGSDFVRFLGELVIIIGLICIVISEIMLLLSIWRKGKLEVVYWYLPRPWRRSGFNRCLSIMFVIFHLAVIVNRLELDSEEDIYLAVCLLCGWMNAIDFFIIYEPTACFPDIIHKVFIEDLLKRWIPVFALTLLATASATFVIYQGTNPEVAEFPGSDYSVAIFSLFKLTYGLLDADYVYQSREPFIGTLLFIIYIWLGTTLLLNLLIAMMTETYTKEKKRYADAHIAIKASYALYLEKLTWGVMSVKYDTELSIGGVDFTDETELNPEISDSIEEIVQGEEENRNGRTTSLGNNRKAAQTFVKVGKFIRGSTGDEWMLLNAVMIKKDPRTSNGGDINSLNDILETGDSQRPGAFAEQINT